MTPEILRSIDLKAQSGALILRRSATEKKLYFHKGALAFASSNLEQEGLGQMLVNQGKLSPLQWDAASRSKNSEEHPGVALARPDPLARTSARPAHLPRHTPAGL